MNIDTDEDFPEHPKTVRFCALVGNPLGWGYLWKLWRWCAKFQKDGDISAYTPAEIELHVGWSAMDGRFFEAAVKAGFIDRDAAGTRVHNWMRRMGAGLIRMEIDRVRKSIARAKQSQDAAEVTRLEALVTTLRTRLRTSDAVPSDVHRTGDGQTPNGVGPVTEFHRTADVSALLCSALPCSDPPPPARAQDPTELVAPPPPPRTAPEANGNGATIHPLPSGPKLVGYDLLRLYGEIRSEHVEGALPWDSPVSSDGKAETFAERLSPEAAADVRSTMKLHFRELVAGEGKTGALENPTLGFGCWCGDFTRLREKLHSRSREPAKAAKKASEPWFDPNNQPR